VIRYKWIIAVCAIAAVVSALAIFRGYREVVPPRAWGRLLMDFTHDHGNVSSPGGTRSVRVSVEEVGAQRSGNPYMWVSRYSLVGGYEVFAEGFIDAADYEARRRPPLVWTGEREVEIAFSEGKSRWSAQQAVRYEVP
jgi:hypothetical protein